MPSPTPRPRVLLADDHRMVAEGIRALLEPEFDLVGIVEDGQALVETARRSRPDVIVADVTMPRLGGIDALVLLKKADPAVRVVFLTMQRSAAYAGRAFEAGALGYVLKHSAPDELVKAVRAALAGRRFVSPVLAEEVVALFGPASGAGGAREDRVTPRQREVLRLLADGRTAKEVASALGISPRTVEFHKYRLMAALGVRTVPELVRAAIKSAILEP